MIVLSPLLFTCCTPPEYDDREWLASAMNNRLETYGNRVPVLVTDADGKPLHSWRVLILPFVQANSFWEEYNHTSAWDDPSNADLVDGSRQRPGDKFPYPADAGEIYRSVIKPRSQETRYVLLISGPLEAKPYDNNQIAYYVPDSQSLVMLEVEASGIHWMEPRDIAGEGADQPGWDTLEEVKPKIVRSIEFDANGTQLRDREETLRFLEASRNAESSNP